MSFAVIEPAGPLTAGPTLSRARLDKSLVDKARSLRASVAELLATAPERPDGFGKANPAAAHTSPSTVRILAAPAVQSRSIEVSIAGLKQRTIRIPPVSAVRLRAKTVESIQRACGGNLENCAATIR